MKTSVQTKQMSLSTYCNAKAIPSIFKWSLVCCVRLMSSAICFKKNVLQQTYWYNNYLDNNE